ncbi:CPBP family intramembrane glutamic endopeptidase [Pseudalkalibacillus sp. SCS-8]|uniref:CPBP family intramembrane glutamic endopeptidase n=1 Tax=Pseudalkalibacillus nanhaiensis TaxID=3115291 RepID=UPI0032DBF29F
MFKVVLPVLVAWLILGIAFQSKDEFWLLFPIVQGGLLLYAWWKARPSLGAPKAQQIFLAVVSGVFLYGLFAFGKTVVLSMAPTLFEELGALYGLIQPKTIWHTLLVFVLIIPAEEWFWRGFVQSSLPGSSVFRIGVAVTLYAAAHIASGSLLLVAAALVAGLFWGILYEYTQSLLPALISHWIFDLFFFLLFPLL